MTGIGATLSIVGIIALYVIGLLIVLKVLAIIVTLPGKVARLEERIAKLEKGKK